MDDLLHIENQSLEIFAFGVVDVYRVVGRLRQLVEYAYVAAGDGCGREYGRAEQLLGDSLRAGEGKEYTAAALSMNKYGVTAMLW